MTFTPPGSPARGTETLRTAAASAAPFSLLSVASPLVTPPGVVLAEDGLPRSVRRDHQRCVTAAALENCPTVDPELDPEGENYSGIPNQAPDPGYAFYPFSWAVPVGCEHTHPNYDRLAEVAEEDVVAATAWNVSHQLWTGAANASSATDSPSLATAAVVLGGLEATAVDPADGLALLAEAFYACDQGGGGALYHVPNTVNASIRSGSATGIQVAGSKLVGPSGEFVSRGPGYTADVGPAGTTTADGESWIYVSGPIDLRVGTSSYDPANPYGVPGRPEGVANPRRNENSVARIRRALFAFDTCCVYAVRVTAAEAPGS